MNHSNLDKAATRIQASYRGYKTRKELGSVGSHDQHPSSTSPHTQDEFDSARHKSKISFVTLPSLILCVFPFY